MGGLNKQDKAAGLAPMDSGHRVLSRFDFDKALQVCERIAAGDMSLKDITSLEGMPSRATFQRWTMLYPEVKKAYIAAREQSAHAMEDKALDMARRLETQKDFTGTQVRAYEVAMGQYRWSAVRRNPADFAEKTQTSVVVPVQINTTLDLGQAGGGSHAVNENTYQFAARVGAETLQIPPPEGKSGGSEPPVEAEGTPADTNPFDLPRDPTPTRRKTGGGWNKGLKKGHRIGRRGTVAKPPARFRAQEALKDGNT